MSAKRFRESDQASLEVTSLMHDDNILREAANIAQSNTFSESVSLSFPDARRRRMSDEDEDILDRVSLRIVSSLQGSTTLPEAQGKAREVLLEFIKPVELELSDARAASEKNSSANKILGRALVIMRDKLGEAQREATATKEKLAGTEERLRQADHAVQVLRWHLQSDRPMGGIKTPPDIF